MADTLWGNVYFKDIYAGRLKEEPDGRYIFIYDESYLDSNQPAISHSLELRTEPHVSQRAELHPFFDNLISEGWLGDAQIGRIKTKHRFARLLSFGYDLIGAVSVIDPKPTELRVPYMETDKATIAAVKGRASAGGFQRKLLVVKDGKQYRPAARDELSTHIAKFESIRPNPTIQAYSQIEIEYLTTLAISKLLPKDNIVNMEIASITEVDQLALVIQRFDRLNGKRIHFEEFNQLLGHYSYDSNDKYNGAYEDMATFIRNTPVCLKSELDTLLRRVLACLVVSNTDAHFKNFAMLHTSNGMRLSPLYDILAVPVWDSKLKTIALSIGGIKDMLITNIKRKHLLLLGKGFGFTEDITMDAINDLGKHLPNALKAIEKSDIGTKDLRQKLIKTVETRWRGTFASTGQILFTKQRKDD